MKKITLFASIATILFLASAASAQTFTNIHDAVPGKYFSASASVVDGSTLVIGLESGSNPSTFVSNEFRASNLAYQNRMADDTISFTVSAPAGYTIATITYAQHGTFNTYRTAVQRGNTQWTVAGFPALIGEYISPNVGGAVDLSTLQLSSVGVSITASLFVGPTGDIAITNASVYVTFQPSPDVQADGSLVSILD